MKYTIKSDNFTLGKKGDVVEASKIESLGLNIVALIAAGHIGLESASIKEKQIEGDAD